MTRILAGNLHRELCVTIYRASRLGVKLKCDKQYRYEQYVMVISTNTPLNATN